MVGILQTERHPDVVGGMIEKIQREARARQEVQFWIAGPCRTVVYGGVREPTIFGYLMRSTCDHAATL